MSKEKYDTGSETKSDNNEKLAHKRHVQYCRARDSCKDNNLSFDCNKKFRCSREKGLPEICPVNDCFPVVLDCRTHFLAETSPHCDK